ncbi:restriction endonuclease [Rhodococcus sp. IEGM 1351]|uniref:restriction endonuclease n=1 Tax=Rhodococcus sp. IEGM 1351 TaxID=3047089 RepID=UPI0024B831C4|nr:restriction endonuclease [Rhodococcus sp. IEGM 1351]MDI9934695.1 restriction endonuclease [Rhodococcus sp. IEGM 1351]
MQYITTAHEAELNAALVMKSWGYTDAVATTGGADGGIDVRSSRALAQVKWRGGAAGRPEMQQLYGSRAADTSKALFFFAASAYSDQAVQYADQVGIGLFIYDPVGAVTAVNKVAQQFVVAAPKGTVAKAKMPLDDVLLFGAGALALIGAVILFVLLAGK